MKKRTETRCDESPRSRENFERAMAKLFQVPKSDVQGKPTKKTFGLIPLCVLCAPCED
jgi:hypothetical protein